MPDCGSDLLWEQSLEGESDIKAVGFTTYLMRSLAPCYKLHRSVFIHWCGFKDAHTVIPQIVQITDCGTFQLFLLFS